ncbi:hypothetical protein ACFE04_005701 [Oxalis oulophora]
MAMPSFLSMAPSITLTLWLETADVKVMCGMVGLVESSFHAQIVAVWQAVLWANRFSIENFPIHLQHGNTFSYLATTTTTKFQHTTHFSLLFHPVSTNTNPTPTNSRLQPQLPRLYTSIIVARLSYTSHLQQPSRLATYNRSRYLTPPPSFNQSPLHDCSSNPPHHSRCSSSRNTIVVPLPAATAFLSHRCLTPATATTLILDESSNSAVNLKLVAFMLNSG